MPVISSPFLPGQPVLPSNPASGDSADKSAASELSMRRDSVISQQMSHPGLYDPGSSLRWRRNLISGIDAKCLVERTIVTPKRTKTIITLAPALRSNRFQWDNIGLHADMDYRVQVDPDLVKAKVEAALLRAREDQLSEDQSGSYVDCPASFIQYPSGGGDLGLVRSLRRDTYGDEEKTDLYCHGSASGKIGMAWLQGARKTMEDAHFAAVFQLDLAGRNVPVKFSVLCDGHGGDGAAKYVKKIWRKR